MVLVIHGRLVCVGHITTSFLLLLLYLGQWVEHHIAIVGEIAVLRVARTVKNGGKEFWGCPHYKV